MVLDTSSLNTDIGSLYNICSSLSDLISTITGGGGGGDGKYYLALSDAVNSSLSYVYNMTGNIASIPYNNINFFGNLDYFANYSIPSTIKKFTISNVKTISKITMSNSTSSSAIRTLNNILFCAENFNGNSFKYLGYMSVFANSLMNNTFASNLLLSINGNTISNCDILYCSGNLSAFTISDCSLYMFGRIEAKDLLSNHIAAAYTIDALTINNNTLSSCNFPVLNADYIAYNSFSGNFIRDFYCSKFVSNNVIMVNDCHVSASEIIGNVLYQSSRINDKLFDVKFKARTISQNRFGHLRNVSLLGEFYDGDCEYSDVKGVYFYNFSKIISTFNLGGRTLYNTNNFDNVGIFDVHELTIPVSMAAYIIVGIQTMRLNYDWKWSFVPTANLSNIQPSNIYTLDFYKCENYISNSIFTIPSYYSGYDEGNVWISGKPLSELGYTLSVSA
jgi:hypothetical protein